MVVGPKMTKIGHHGREQRPSTWRKLDGFSVKFLTYSSLLGGGLHHVEGYSSRPWCPILVIFGPTTIYASRRVQRTQIHTDHAWSACTVPVSECPQGVFRKIIQIPRFMWSTSTRSRCHREILRPLLSELVIRLPLKSAFRFCLRHQEGVELVCTQNKWGIPHLFPTVAGSK